MDEREARRRAQREYSDTESSGETKENPEAVAKEKKDKLV